MNLGWDLEALESSLLEQRPEQHQRSSKEVPWTGQLDTSASTSYEVEDSVEERVGLFEGRLKLELVIENSRKVSGSVRGVRTSPHLKRHKQSQNHRGLEGDEYNNGPTSKNH